MQATVVDRVADLLAGVRRVVVITGAGMSQESGVPTFRDARSGLWSRFDPEELATEAAFRRHPARVFGWYLARWKQARGAIPHPGYRALVQLTRAFDDLVVVTQNVDGLHQRAGSPAVVELHGSLHAFRCLDGGHPYDPACLEEAVQLSEEEIPPPECPRCGSLVRPGVVWFGEPLPALAVERAWTAVERCDALLVIGTSALVYPAAGLPWLALDRERPVVEMNPDRTPLSERATLSWQSRAGAALTALSARLGYPVLES